MVDRPKSIRPSKIAMIATNPRTAKVAFLVSFQVGHVTLRNSARHASTYFIKRVIGLGRLWTLSSGAGFVFFAMRYSVADTIVQAVYYF